MPSLNTRGSKQNIHGTTMKEPKRKMKMMTVVILFRHAVNVTDGCLTLETAPILSHMMSFEKLRPRDRPIVVHSPYKSGMNNQCIETW